MQNIYKKIILILYFCVCTKSVYSYAVIINPVDKEPPTAQELIFQNRSILKCGTFQDETVLTLLDVQTLLAISNLLYDKIPITTDWNNFSAIKVNLYRLSDKIPQDVLRVLFLCLNWRDTKLTNLFATSDSELQDYLIQVKQAQPWKIYSVETQKKINQLSDNDLKELIDMVIRAKLAQSVRGDLKSNQSLKSIRFAWLL